MTITFLDIALPIGLAAIFGVYRYVGHLKSDPEHAIANAAVDAVKGAAGLAVITLIYKFVAPS